MEIGTGYKGRQGVGGSETGGGTSAGDRWEDGVSR